MIPERSRAVGPFVAAIMFLAALVLVVFVLVPRIVGADLPPSSSPPSSPDCGALEPRPTAPARGISTGRVDAVTGVAVHDHCHGGIAAGDRDAAAADPRDCL